MDLKEAIEDKKQISASQLILKEEYNGEQYELKDKDFLYNLKSNSRSLKLQVKNSLEHYGFNENYEIKYEEFRDFFIETEEEMTYLTQDCTLKKEDEKAFFRKLIKFLLTAAKKKFRFEFVL